MKPAVKRLQQLLYKKTEHMRLRTLLVIVIAAATVLVGIGYAMYEQDSNRKYDIDRPGQITSNEVLSVEDDEADTTSRVDEKAAKTKLERYQKELKALDSLGTFDPEALNDQNLQLAPPDQPSL